MRRRLPRQDQRQVLLDRQMLPQGGRLEDHAQPRVGEIHRLTAYAARAAGLRTRRAITEPALSY